MPNKEKENEEKLDESLHLDYKTDDGIWIKSGKSLRRVIGMLGIALPILLLLISTSFYQLKGPLDSISDYHFTPAASLLHSILVLIAAFLIIYSGEETIDWIVSSLAGIGAIMVVIFPTKNPIASCCENDKPYFVTHLPNGDIWNTLHFVSAAIFLVSLAYMTLFLFTKSDKTPDNQTPEKRKRNKIYIACGTTMILALLVIFLNYIGLIPDAFYDGNHMTFWMEFIAIEAFGISWLVKGNTIIQDKNGANKKVRKA